MRLIDADELIEHAWRDKLDSRELIVEMIEKAPTIKEIPTKIPIDVFEHLLGLAEESRDYMKENKEYIKKLLNGETIPTKCIACRHFIDLPIGDISNELAISFGSCDKAMKNFTTIDPCNQIPSWCPLKGEKNDQH